MGETSVNKNFPKVSVIISTFNRPALLGKALASVHAQEFGDFEVIVVDDASPDTEAVRSVLDKWHAEFEVRDIDLIAFRLDENSGYQCMPKNKGIEWARGDYIAYLDDDNTWRPEHLKLLIEGIEADLSTDLVYSRCHYVFSDASVPYLVHDDGGICWPSMERIMRAGTDTCPRNHSENSRTIEQAVKDMSGGGYPSGDSDGVPWDPSKLTERNYIDTSTMLHSKGAFWRLVRDSGFGWDETLRRFGDWNFVWRWALAGNTGKLVDAVTVDYNVHPGSIQMTRPAIEVPVCWNFAQYQAFRKDRNRELRVAS